MVAAQAVYALENEVAALKTSYEQAPAHLGSAETILETFTADAQARGIDP